MGLRARDRVLRPSKEQAELRYWRWRADSEGTLANAHYGHIFTTHFNLSRVSLAGKRLLDVECGARGSLAWATMAAERVGLDPLADSYRALGADRHEMTYVSARAEKMPFEDAHFDVVTCLKALDHVDSVQDTSGELIRVATTARPCC